ncbi:MAG TPA: Gfo/Idh/MocA family oxidoreductase [Fimbriimonas sp.]|nr:Gfo/Idh/MocA family oxidoreductase [Fimbriimonas sp.]
MLRVAVAGLGGFAADHHAALARLEEEGLCQVVATCDPNPSLTTRSGVERFFDLNSLLDAHVGQLDLLTLPIPVPLHASFHRIAVQAGVACYLEKPPTLWWPELQSMIEVDSQAGKQTQVGFNFVGDPFRRGLKQRILNGEFGALREVRFCGIWPRDEAYYTRNNWAGKLRVGDQWVVDSCIGNAMAHYVQNLLFWCGRDLDSVGSMGQVSAWLGRTRPIESFDTAFVEAAMEGGVKLRISATHLQSAAYVDEEVLVFDRTRIVFKRWNEAVIDGVGFRSDVPDNAAMLRHNLSHYLGYLKGETDHPTTSLNDSKPFVALCDLALVSSGAIHDIRGEGLLDQVRDFYEEGAWPSQTPLPVGMPGLSKLSQVAEALR